MEMGLEVSTDVILADGKLFSPNKNIKFEIGMMHIDVSESFIPVRQYNSG